MFYSKLCCSGRISSISVCSAPDRVSSAAACAVPRSDQNLLDKFRLGFDHMPSVKESPLQAACPCSSTGHLPFLSLILSYHCVTDIDACLLYQEVKEVHKQCINLTINSTFKYAIRTVCYERVLIAQGEYNIRILMYACTYIHVVHKHDRHSCQTS
jgi:hypothetical protein